MSTKKSILMLSNTGTEWNVIGDPVRASAFYGYGSGIHTVQVILQNFIGGIGIQATLALDPKPEDWFWIKLNPMGEINIPYITYPVDPLAPTGNNGGDTGSVAHTFMGNFTFVRMVMTREYLQPVPPQKQDWKTWAYGQIDRCLLSI